MFIFEQISEIESLKIFGKQGSRLFIIRVGGIIYDTAEF